MNVKVSKELEVKINNVVFSYDINDKCLKIELDYSRYIFIHDMDEKSLDEVIKALSIIREHAMKGVTNA